MPRPKMLLVAASAFLALVAAEDLPSGSCTTDEVELLQRELMVKSSPKAISAAPEEKGSGLQASCAQEYKAFLSEPLAATQLQKDASNKPQSFASFEHYPGVPWSEQQRFGGLSVLVDQDFAICQIPKVASSEWMTVLAKVVLGNVSANDKYDALAALLPLSEPSMAEAVFSNPKAIRVVFVRETLSRLRSSFLNKCNKTAADDLGACPMSDGIDGRVLTVKDVVEWIAKTDVSGPDVPAHWMPQSNFCELRTRISEYNVIGYYDKDNLCKDAACVMEMAGISRFNTLGPEFDNAPFWEPVPEKFDINGAPVSTSASDDEEIALLKKLFTKEAGRQVIKSYWSDYETFNFPHEPDWLKDATGELYTTALKDLPL